MTAAPQAATRPATVFPDRHYGLFLREGTNRFHWKFRNEGISLSGQTLHWQYDGRARGRTLADIRSVRLMAAHVHKSGDVGICQIVFRDGLMLTCQSSNASGLADDERAPKYTAFVRDLHARLAAAGPDDIRYKAGDSGGRHTFGIIILVIATLFFVALPFVLLFIVQRWEVLGILGAGAAFVWPVWKAVERNTPRDYKPTQIPDDLLL